MCDVELTFDFVSELLIVDNRSVGDSTWVTVVEMKITVDYSGRGGNENNGRLLR